jgi:hypothetical protein
MVGAATTVLLAASVGTNSALQSSPPVPAATVVKRLFWDHSTIPDDPYVKPDLSEVRLAFGHSGSRPGPFLCPGSISSTADNVVTCNASHSTERSFRIRTSRTPGPIDRVHAFSSS